jgi:hypothetical protein
MQSPPFQREPSFSAFLDDNMQKYVSSFGPKDGTPLLTENVSKTTYSYSDFAADPKNQVFIRFGPRDYTIQRVEQDEFINALCKISTEEKEYTVMQRMLFTNSVAERAAHGTVANFLTHTTDSKVYKNEYYSKGFEVDWYTADTAEGIEDIDMKMDNIVSRTQRTSINTIIHALYVNPEDAQNPLQLHGENAVFKDPISYFKWEQTHSWGIINKQADAMQIMLKDANDVFAQFGPNVSTTHIVMDVSDPFFLANKVEYTVKYDTSGNSGASNRESMLLPNDFSGVKYLQVPFVERNVADALNHSMKRETSAMAVVNFYTLGSDEISLYESFHRDQRYVSYKTDSMDTYRFIDQICALPHYIPLTGNTNIGTSDLHGNNNKNNGQLNYHLLEQLAKECGKKGSNLLTGMNISNGNEQVIDDYLNAVDPAYASEYCEKDLDIKFHPTTFLGEIHQARCDDNLMRNVGLSVAKYIYSDLSPSELTHFSNMIHHFSTNDFEKFKLTKDVDKVGTDTNNKNNNDDDTNNNNKNNNNNGGEKEKEQAKKSESESEPKSKYNNLLSDYIASLPENVRDELKTAIESIENKIIHLFPDHFFLTSLDGVSHSILLANFECIFLFYSEIKYSEEDLKISGISGIKGGNANEVSNFLNGIKTFDDPRKNIITNGAFPVNLFSKYSPFTPELNAKSKVSTLARRLLKSMAEEPHIMFAIQLNIWSSRTLQNAMARYKYNVQIPYGGMNIRPEWQEMTSMLAVSSAPGEKLVEFNIHSRDEIYTAMTITRKMNYMMEFSQGAGVLDGRRMHWLHNVRGGKIMGGSDNKYANQYILTTETNTNLRKFNKNLRTSGSNIALCGSYNQSCEPHTNHLWCFDQRGFFHPEMARHVSGNEWRTETYGQRNPVGLVMHNYLQKFSQNAYQRDTPELFKLNFNEISALSNRNNIARQLNSWFYDPISKKHVKTSSLHVWGELNPGSRKIVTSETTLSADVLYKTLKTSNLKSKYEAFN